MYVFEKDLIDRTASFTNNKQSRTFLILYICPCPRVQMGVHKEILHFNFLGQDMSSLSHSKEILYTEKISIAFTEAT